MFSRAFRVESSTVGRAVAPACEVQGRVEVYESDLSIMDDEETVETSQSAGTHMATVGRCTMADLRTEAEGAARTRWSRIWSDPRLALSKVVTHSAAPGVGPAWANRAAQKQACSGGKQESVGAGNVARVGEVPPIDKHDLKCYKRVYGMLFI